MNAHHFHCNNPFSTDANDAHAHRCTPYVVPSVILLSPRIFPLDDHPPFILLRCRSLHRIAAWCCTDCNQVVIEWRLPKRVGGYALAHEIVELSIPVDWSGNAPTMAMRRARDRMIDAIVCRLPWTIIDMLSDAYVTARMSPFPVGLFFVDDEL
jgi:hypothetical protein